MDAPTHFEAAPSEPNGTAPGTAVARIRELLATMDAEPTLHERDAALEDHDIDSHVDTLDESLEAVELELALHNQNLISLGFEESVETALKDIGGEILFQMRMEREDCQRIAAVRIGSGEEQQFALVIMPPGGGLMRVEPVEQSSNPLAPITESYASLMDTFRTVA